MSHSVSHLYIIKCRRMCDFTKLARDESKHSEGALRGAPGSDAHAGSERAGSQLRGESWEGSLGKALGSDAHPYSPEGSGPVYDHTLARVDLGAGSAERPSDLGRNVGCV
jgi:hypothetical protein